MIKPKRTVQKMRSYVPPKEEREKYMRLDFNESTIGASPKVIEAIQNISAEEIATYPEYNDFIKQLAKFAKVKQNEVLATNGSDEAIKLIMDTYLEEGDEIVLPVPTFDMIDIYATAVGAKVNKINYDDNLNFPTENVLKSLNSKTKIVVLVNPNNPTGTSIKREDIEKILKKAKKALVFIDEAYYPFSKQTAIDLIKNYDNLIIARTFSKAFGLAGLRVGFLVSASVNIENMEKVLSPYSVNRVAVIAAVATLQDIQYVENYADEVRVSKELLYEFLESKGIDYWNSAANFVLANFGKDCDKTEKKLKANGILVRSRTNDVMLEGCLRITVGTKAQTKQLIAILESIKEGKKKGLIFDMDGVLVDVRESYRESIKKTAEFFLGRLIEMEVVEEIKNKPGYNDDYDAVEGILEKEERFIERDNVVKKFQEYYLGRNFCGFVRNEKPLITEDRLKKLRTRFKLGIVTGRNRMEAKYALEMFGLSQYFDAIITRDDVVNPKPDPEGLVKAMEKLKVTEAVYVGDNIDDAAAAKTAKVDFLGVIAPGTDPKKSTRALKSKGAKKIIESMDKLEEGLV
ncbi:histidinol-phosphate transaminase [Nanoarchaeota archaeon]